MSIRLYSGIMGSGKTYRVVYELFYTDLLEKYFIFHNLEELKIDSKYLKEFGKNTDFNPPELFTYEYQQKLSKQIREEYGRNILWIIEECDKIGFDRAAPSVKEWLSMHRHLGQDIYLISQSKWNIAKEYMNLVEVEIQGKRGFVFDQFIYSWFSNGEKVATDRLPKKKDVYEKYKSFHIPELKKKRSNIWKWALVFFIFSTIGTIYFFFFGLPDKFSSIGESVNQSKNITIQKFDDTDNEIESHKNRYTYAGKVGQNVYLADQNGNIYLLPHIYKKSEYVSDDERRALSLITAGLPEYKATFIKQLARRGPGREARPGQAQEQADEQIIVREMWINVF